MKTRVKKSSPPKADNHVKRTFTLQAPGAHSVLLVGDFTQWQQSPIPMHNGTAAGWRVEAELAPGPHRYRFLVDGEWVDDPECTDRVPNAFGSQDCLCQTENGPAQSPD